MKAGRRRIPAALATAAGVLLAAGGVAYATIPDSSGAIHGCYARSGGSLRVIDATVTNCKTGETSLDWNVQGQQGPQGHRGRTPIKVPENAAADIDLDAESIAEIEAVFV